MDFTYYALNISYGKAAQQQCGQQKSVTRNEVIWQRRPKQLQRYICCQETIILIIIERYLVLAIYNIFAWLV